MTHSTDSFNVGVNKGEMTHSIRVTWLILYVDMAHVICVTWLIQYAWHGSFNMCDMTHSTWVVSKRVKWLIHMRGVIFSYVWHDSFIPVTWIVHTCDMTQSIRVTWLIQYVGHDSFIRVTALIHACVCVCDMTHPTRVTWLILHVWHDSSYTCDMTDSYVRHDSFIHVTWLILYVWYDWFIFREMAHSYVGHDLLICATWLIHTCTTIQVSDVTHSRIHYNLYVWYDSFTHTIIYMCDMTHSHIQQFMRVTCKGSWVWHDSFLSVTWLIHTCDMTHWICLTRLIHMCHVTHAHMWYDSFICVTWLIHMCDMTLSYVWHDSLIMSINALSSN